MLTSRLLKAVHAASMLSVVLAVIGCIPAVTVPIETIHYDDKTAGNAHVLMVYLPGRGDPMTAVGENGLVDAVRKRGLPVDIIGVNAHMGYYLNGTVFTRIQEDVILPAETRGYEQIWLIGNSLGGYGSLSFAGMHPEEITGVVLLGPYLGRAEVVEEIKEAGGIRDWEPRTIRLHTEDQWDKGLWLYVKARAEGRSAPEQSTGCAKRRTCVPKIYLGYGRSDRFSQSQAYLASLLPPDHVLAIEGGHDWDTWEELWNAFLDRHIFEREP